MLSKRYFYRTLILTIFIALLATGISFAQGTVEGIAYYKGDTNQRIINVEVLLINDQDSVVDNTVTDSSGVYTFSNVLPGLYKTKVNSQGPSKGFSMYEAIVALKYAAGSIQLDAMEVEALDVTNNSSITHSDAMLIFQHYINQIDTFPRRDWVSETPEFTVTAPAPEQIISSRVASAVLSPGGPLVFLLEDDLRELRKYELGNERLLYTTDNQFEYSIRLDNIESAVGQSIVYKFDETLFEVLSITSESSEIAWRISDNLLTIGVFSTEKVSSVNKRFNSENLIVCVRTKSTHWSNFKLEVASYERFNHGLTEQSALISLPTMINSRTYVYPNPCSEYLYIQNPLQADSDNIGTYAFRIYTINGSIVNQGECNTSSIGITSVPTQALNPGLYYIVLEKSGDIISSEQFVKL